MLYEVLFISHVVAHFLFNTGRALKAIEIFKECLIFINNEVPKQDQKTAKLCSCGIYAALIKAYSYLRDYRNAIKCGRKFLAIGREYGETGVERNIAMKLANIYEGWCEYAEARELYERLINIMIETGDREEESYAYAQCGTMSVHLGEYDKAKEYFKKALPIKIEIGDREDEASCYGNLGIVFQSLGEYDKAKKYHEKALAIGIEIGDKGGEAASYINLGTVFQSVGEHDQAKEYLEKALAIRTEISDKQGEAASYGNLGTVFQSLGEYDKAKEYHEKALAIRTEIGDRAGEATDYGNLGTLFCSLGEYDKAREYHEKALAISIEIGNKEGEATHYANLGHLFHSLGEYVVAEGYLEKSFPISRDIGDREKMLKCLFALALVQLAQGKIKETFAFLLLSINHSETLHGLLKDNDQFKISLSDALLNPFRSLSLLLCLTGHPNDALYAEDLARARALADLMATQYSVKSEISADPQSWIGMENIMKKESNCVCLYISYYEQDVFLWILKSSGVIRFRGITVDENFVGAGLVGRLPDFFDKNFRSCGIAPEESCEDRSLNDIEPKLKSFQEESVATLRLVEEDDGEGQNLESSVYLCYRILIAPVTDLLDEPEIIIVPDRSLNQVPFAALSDEGGKYLSETFRIRIVPSLSTLKLIQDSPANYHSQTGALIVGDPVVGEVLFKGRHMTFQTLPCARNEAEMIGELLGVQPLLGEDATKQAVLEKLHSVSLIHFAAHGNAERGEIALSPLRLTDTIPQEEDYLLAMSDISQVRLRAKLVVLSCCHSGRGQIRAEGVVGIARAFLGSGARSVLVALWAIDDIATEQFMRRFYEHLVHGESASESLHEAMKWIRSNGFAKVSEWAPFMLIGDNVTFKFGK